MQITIKTSRIVTENKIFVQIYYEKRDNNLSLDKINFRNGNGFGKP